MATERKVAQVAELQALIESSEVAIGTAYQGMPVTAQTELRAHLTASGVGLKVIKNTLFRLAADAAGRSEWHALAQGPTALVTHPDDPVAAARAVMSYRRDNADTPFAVYAAVVSGELVDAAYIEDLATVPPKEELVARIAGGLVGKIGELAMLLSATTREFAQLVEARAQQLESEGGEA